MINNEIFMFQAPPHYVKPYIHLGYLDWQSYTFISSVNVHILVHISPIIPKTCYVLMNYEWSIMGFFPRKMFIVKHDTYPNCRDGSKFVVHLSMSLMEISNLGLMTPHWKNTDWRWKVKHRYTKKVTCRTKVSPFTEKICITKNIQNIHAFMNNLILTLTWHLIG